MNADNASSNDPIPTVCVCSRLRAERILHGQDPLASLRSLLSIGDPGQPGCSGPRMLQFVVRLEFSDLLGPSTKDVEQIVAFASKARQLQGACLVHCEAGISRSTAATIVLFASWFGPGREQDAALALLRLVPRAMPNAMLVAIADRCLDRQGALIDAVDETFLSLRMA